MKPERGKHCGKLQPQEIPWRSRRDPKSQPCKDGLHLGGSGIACTKATFRRQISSGTRHVAAVLRGQSRNRSLSVCGSEKPSKDSLPPTLWQEPFSCPRYTSGFSLTMRRALLSSGRQDRRRPGTISLGTWTTLSCPMW